MQTITSTCLSFLLLLLVMESSAAELRRNDINPALIYYQAFLSLPDYATEFSGEDRAYLFETNWYGKHLDERFGRLISKHAGSFELLRQAASATVPCDWGLDLTKGPVLTLPHLAKAKHLVQMVLLEVSWQLQNGRQTEARDNLLAALTLGRRLPGDGLEISTLVQMSIEALVTSSVAEHFYQFNPEVLPQIIEGFDGIPRRTLAGAVPGSKFLFCERYLKRVGQFQRENPGNDAKVIERIRESFPHESARKGEPDPLEQLIEAAGGTGTGVAKLLSEQALYYDRLAAMMAMPYGRYVAEMGTFKTEVEKQSNPLLRRLLRWDKHRRREFNIEAKLAMIRAAVEYKVHGKQGFDRVVDPYGNVPFVLRRFVLQGVDRGFELKSSFNERGSGVLIFVEKSGTPFFVEGVRAGQVVESVSLTEEFQRRYGILPQTNK